MSEGAASPGLTRALGLWLLTGYGVGVTVGAGIYVLIGAVAGAAGEYAPLSFLAAGVVAAFTGLTYAELCVRFPFAAGEAVYAEEAFRFKPAAMVTGLLVLSAGIVAAGTITLGAAGYLNAIVGLDQTASVAIILALLTALAASGIKQSVLFASLVTVLEVGGLLLVSVLALLGDPAPSINEPALSAGAILPGILGGAVLAFFAYIGFEDMVNVAEEVEAPEKNMPRAIILTLVVSGALYLLVSYIAVRSVAPTELAASNAPLALVAARGGALGEAIVGGIAVIAALNGILVQIIMGSRVIYGLARRGHAPAMLGSVHALTRTPIRATLVFSLVAGILAISFPLARLATSATQIILVIFLLMNLALIAIKLRRSGPRPTFAVHMIVPLVGALATLGLLLISVFE